MDISTKTNYMIAVAGMMGSGKTTLARNLAVTLGWTYLPDSGIAKTFLGDLFADPDRWAFDAQIAFLCEKAIQIKQHLRRGQRIVLDRTLDEDVEIFARHFFETGRIDERSYSIYRELAAHLRVPEIEPDLTIFCDVGKSTIEQRLRQRGRIADALYPEDHLFQIFGRYADWRRLNEERLFVIEADKVDFRTRGTMAELAIELASIIGFRDSPNVQADFFFEDSSDEFNSFKSKPLILFTPPRQVGINYDRYLEKTQGRVFIGRTAPYAYIAAPFTAVATTPKASESKQFELFQNDAPHGRIPAGRFRTALNQIASSVSRYKLAGLLPHRDINAWGKKLLTPKEVFEKCTQQVEKCSLFIGLIGNSLGSHYEYGVAKALGIPCVIIHCNELGSSFISTGIQTGKLTLVMECAKLGEIKTLMGSPEFDQFILRNVVSGEINE